MKNKLKVSVLGATGLVGQNYIKLLQSHPWFELVDLASSPRSAGKFYWEAINKQWLLSGGITEKIKNTKVRDASDIYKTDGNVDIVFSALDYPDKRKTKKLEFDYAKAGFPLISNNSANRWTEDVPMIIPEINHEHTELIPIQQSNRGFNKGFVVTKPNCSLQSYLVTLVALEKAGYPVEKVQVTTMQALSGGGKKALDADEMRENVIPFIKGEEEKTEQEPLKILGDLTTSGINNTNKLSISSTCTRVPVIDGHIAVVNILFKNKIPTVKNMKSIWNNYKSVPQLMKFPFAPENPIIYFEDENHPQPKINSNLDKGMAVSVGRLRKDKIFDARYISLSHNAIRGAAGGAILTAELLVSKGYIGA